jgi:hypothetical protein
MSAVVMFEPTSSYARAGRQGRPLGTSRPRPPRSISRSNRAAAVYRRRRLVAATIVVGAVLAVGHAGVALGGTSLAAPDARPRVVTHVVEPGDTLWSIARELAPESDPRPVVDAIAHARHDAPLVPGEVVTWLAS